MTIHYNVNYTIFIGSSVLMILMIFIILMMFDLISPMVITGSWSTPETAGVWQPGQRRLAESQDQETGWLEQCPMVNGPCTYLFPSFSTSTIAVENWAGLRDPTAERIGPRIARAIPNRASILI
uniref:ARAD1A11066p n=1 Tax=Blastobotrys adeninivorans TaxID=409370 RepID=A0A060SXQ0_BLAAD